MLLVVIPVDCCLFGTGGSLVIGIVAGLCGEGWSLGFIVETEEQVVAHLQSHLKRLPLEDVPSRAVIKQMIIDEGHHATQALESGGYPLPDYIKSFMVLTSKFMTTVAYRI